MSECKNGIDDARENLTKVLTYKIVTTIQNHYGSLEAFKTACKDKSNKAVARYVRNFHVDSKILHKLTRHDGKRCLAQVLRTLDPNRLVYKSKYDFRYKSGKKFSKPSTFYIPFHELDRLFALADTQMSPFRPDSDFYTQEQHKFIDKYILGYCKERKTYEKSQRFLSSIERRKKERLVKLAEKCGGMMDEHDIGKLLDAIDFTD